MKQVDHSHLAFKREADPEGLLNPGNDPVAGDGRGAAGAETIATSVANWLARFERALAGSDDGLLESLFHADSHWRDLLALTWRIRTVNGARAILEELKGHVSRARPTDFRIDPDRAAPRWVTHVGAEAIFRFETAKLLRNDTLKTYRDFLHGMITTQAETVNADLLAFFKGMATRTCSRHPRARLAFRRGPARSTSLALLMRRGVEPERKVLQESEKLSRRCRVAVDVGVTTGGGVIERPLAELDVIEHGLVERDRRGLDPSGGARVDTSSLRPD